MTRDYRGPHESRYRRRAAEGRTAWSDDEEDARWRVHLLGDLIARVWPEPAPVAALFLGCGDGDIARRVAGGRVRVTGVDVAPTAIASATRLAAGLPATFLEADVRSLPFPEGTFDLVVDDHCLHCILGDDRRAVLAEARRVLKPTGRFHVRTMCSTPAGFDPSDAHRHFGEPEALRAEIAAAGFDILGTCVEPMDSGFDMLVVEAGRSSAF